MSGAPARIGWLGLYAIAMALVEAALVVHLRHVYYPEDPLTIFPLRLMSPADFLLELGRELATIVMIGAVAWLAEKTWMRRFAAFVLVFGLWDVFYYAWLKIAIDWPQHWLDWDVLFFIPWLWLGPWLTPVAIAVLFVVWAAVLLLRAGEARFTTTRLIAFVAGALIDLFTFLAPAWPLVWQDREAVRGFEPPAFHWPLFILGWLLMAAALVSVLRNRAEPAGASANGAGR
jgi:hypothetical protein